jgi:NADPH2:quinone reductase
VLIDSTWPQSHCFCAAEPPSCGASHYTWEDFDVLALRAHNLAGPTGLRLEDLPDRVYAEQDSERSVCVAVHAAGVSFADTLLCLGQFDIPLPLPFIPGMEVSGQVISAPVGCGFQPGDRVCGHVVTGGFAELAWIRPDTLAPLADKLSFIDGAASVVNFHVAFLALWKRAQLCAGESVLVHGAGGGLGSAMVQIATALGAHVFGVASSPEGREVALAAGAHDVCGPDDWSEAIRAAGGVDVVVDPIGGAAFEQSVYCLAPEGRLITVGSTSSTPGRVTSHHLLRYNCSVTGVMWPTMIARDRTLFTRTAKQIDEFINHGLRPMVTKTYDLSHGADALQAIEDRTSTGKLVLTMR